MTNLVDIGAGTWVDPQSVRQIIAFDKSEGQKDWCGRVVIASIPARVIVTLDQQVLTFDFASIEAAREAADEMANAVNGFDNDPDDPAREDLPESEDEKVVVLKARAA